MKDLPTYFNKCDAPLVSEIDNSVMDVFHNIREDCINNIENEEARGLIPLVTLLSRFYIPLYKLFKVIDKRVKEEDAIKSQDWSKIPFRGELTIQEFYCGIIKVSSYMAKEIINRLPCGGNAGLAKNDLIQSIYDKDLNKFETTIREYDVDFTDGLKICSYILELENKEICIIDDVTTYTESIEKNVEFSDDNWELYIDRLFDISFQFAEGWELFIDKLRIFFKKRNFLEAFFTMCYMSDVDLRRMYVSWVNDERLLPSDIKKIKDFCDETINEFPDIEDLWGCFYGGKLLSHNPTLLVNKEIYEELVAEMNKEMSSDDENAEDIKPLPTPSEEENDSDEEQNKLLPVPSEEGASDEKGYVESVESEYPDFDLPECLDTPLAQKILSKAVKKGLMFWDREGKFFRCVRKKMTHPGPLIAYLCGRLYCGDEVTLEENDKGYPKRVWKKGTLTDFPENDVKNCFRMEDGAFISNNPGNYRRNRQFGGPPDNYEKIIDPLFDEE